MRERHDGRGARGTVTGQPARRARVVAALLALTAAAAWLLPRPKPAAVLGRLSYPEFTFAVTVSASALAAVLAAVPRERVRRAGTRLALLLGAASVALAIAELVLFALPPRHQMDNPWYMAAGGGTASLEGLPFGRPAGLEWRGLSRGDLALFNGDDDPYARPVVFRTDRDGFRNDQEIREADLVVIGDSFTEAGNLPERETFAARLGQALGLTWRNLGRAGYTAGSELIVLRRYGLACRPGVVVWQLAEANDLDESVEFEEWVAAGRPDFFEHREKGRVTRIEAWQRRSPSHRLFDRLRRKTVYTWALGGTFAGAGGRVHEVRFLAAPGPAQNAAIHPGWAALADALEEGHAVCREAGIRLVVLLIPMKERVMAPHMTLNAFTRRAFAEAGGPGPGATMGERLAAWCRERGVEFVDATDDLSRGAGSGELVYLPFDTHLSARGHEIVAERLVQTVREDGAARGAGPGADGRPEGGR